MLRLVLRRIFFEFIPTLLLVVSATWWMVRLTPGDPFSSELPSTPGARERLLEYYGFDDPLPVQFGSFMLRAAQGDLGHSHVYTDRSVQGIIAEQFPTSFALGGLAFLFALSVGIPTGVLAAVYHNRWQDASAMAPALIGICLPSFVTGPLLLLLFANPSLIAGHGFFPLPPTGWGEPRSMILPVITMGLGLAAYLARLTRAGLLEVLYEPFIRTARAKGVRNGRIIWVHVLRAGIKPVISFLGPATAGILTGSVVVERIFGIPGLGQTIINAAENRDLKLMVGVVVFYAALVLLTNALADMLLAWTDPRQRRSE